jgi:16S rRNA (guanine966-N2)-methyltransferase
MSILQLDIPHSKVVDLYAGSGALGLEALSRGAVSADFVEMDPVSLRALQDNIAALGAGCEARVQRQNALTFAESLDALSYDLAFADPPYSSGDAARLAELWKRNPFARVLSVEHEATTEMPDGGVTRRYGSTAITFYRSEA